MQKLVIGSCLVSSILQSFSQTQKPFFFFFQKKDFEKTTVPHSSLLPLSLNSQYLYFLLFSLALFKFIQNLGFFFLFLFIIIKQDFGSSMEEEKDAYYVVQKGDVIGIYKSLRDLLTEAGISVNPPPPFFFVFFFSFQLCFFSLLFVMFRRI